MTDRFYSDAQSRCNSLPKIYRDTETPGWVGIASSGDGAQVSPRI